MKILFVHEVSWLNKVTYEIHDFPELLSLRGHDVSFLEYDEEQSTRSVGTSALNSGFFVRRAFASRAHYGSRVRIISPRRFLNGMSGRFLAVLFHACVIFFELILKRPDVVVLYSVPTNGWQTVILTRLLRIPIVFRAIDVSHEIRTTFFTSIILRAEKYVYKNVDHVSTHNYSLAKYVNDSRHDENSISIITPGVDLQRFQPGVKSRAHLEKLGINENQRVLIFMGTLFRFSGVFELIQKIVDRLLHDRNLVLLVLGDGEDMERIDSLCRSLGVENQVKLAGRIEYTELGDYLRLGDLAVLPFTNDSKVTNYALPGKVLQYLAVGLPCVSTRLSGLESIISQGEGILFVDSLAELVDVCLELLSDENHRSALGARGRHKIQEVCDWNQQILKFEQLLTTVSRKT